MTEHTQISIATHSKSEMINVTDSVRGAIREKGITTGYVHVFVPHTTAAVTINENADPDVCTDIVRGLNRIVPESGYDHAEGNSPAHIKSSLIGVHTRVEIDRGALVLGTWQGIFFCEFDGPRQRKFYISFHP